MRLFVALLGFAIGCRRDDDGVTPPRAPSPEAFGVVVDGMPIVSVGNGYVTAVTLADGDIVLRSLVDGSRADLERITPRDCPVIDLGDAYFVHGYTCGGDPEAWTPPEVRLECDELAWDGSRIVIARRTHADRASALPPACR
jgi:hypothetical protein